METCGTPIQKEVFALPLENTTLENHIGTPNASHISFKPLAANQIPINPSTIVDLNSSVSNSTQNSENAVENNAHFIITSDTSLTNQEVATANNSHTPKANTHQNLKPERISPSINNASGTTFYETADEDFDSSAGDDMLTENGKRTTNAAEAVFDSPGHKPSIGVVMASPSVREEYVGPTDGPSFIIDTPDSYGPNKRVNASSTTTASRDTTNESMVVDSDGEDYFEEFHLPNTHENAFVRHQSFRKKVQTTPINAPDAERIEGLVRNGEFVRHGSIRKRIVPEEEEYDEEDDYEEDDGDFAFDESSSFSDGIEREIRDIGKCFSEENLDISYSGESHDSPHSGTAARLKRTYSTPINAIAEDASIYSSNKDGSRSIQDMSFKEFKKKVSIGESTLKKIQQCLDFTSYKDLLNLTGRLSDILSPQEVQDIVSHSERYRKYLDNEVLEALSLSYQTNMHSLPPTEGHVPESPASPKTIANTDSGFSSPKTINEDNCLESPLPEELPYRESPEIPNRQLSEAPENLMLIHRLSTPFDGLSAEGIFVESQYDANSSKLKIPAPSIDLNESEETIKTSDSDQEEAERRQSAEFIFEDTNRSNSKLKIIAPSLNLNESEETIKTIDSDDDDVESLTAEEDEDVNSVTYQRMVSVTEGVFDAAVEDDEDYNIRRTERSKSISDSMRNLECSDTLNTSTLSLSMEEGLPSPCDMCPPHPPDLIPELTAAEEYNEERHWRNVVIGGAWRRIDMKVIAPYKRSVSHGGYLNVNKNPVVLISSVYLPDKSRRDYHYVMDNLFMYVLSFVEQLAADDYIMVYLAGGRRSSGPGFHWMKRAYEMIDRRLRKSLKSLLVVHPSLWTRTIVTLSRPFISSKFYRKLQFVPNLTELAQIIPLDQLEIPDSVKQVDFEIMIKEKKKQHS